MYKLLILVISSALIAGCATALQMPQATRIELVPTGKLRVGINLANPLMATKDPATGNMSGVAVDLANELGRRGSAPVEFIGFATPGQLADAVKTGEWDIAFLAEEPARAAIISFSPAYAEIEATYLVPQDSQIRSIAEIDRKGVRVAVAAKTGFDLYLTRTLKQAQLVRGTLTPGAFNIFVTDNLEALAGLRPTLLEFSVKLPGSRILDGRFTAVQQAIGTPGGRTAVAEYLRDFVGEMKASGFVARSIEKHGIRGLSVASNTSTTK